jgi:hypothetical protein
MSKQIQSIDVYTVADIKVDDNLFFLLRRFYINIEGEDELRTSHSLSLEREAGPLAVYAANSGKERIGEFAKELQLLENTGIKKYIISPAE